MAQDRLHFKCWKATRDTKAGFMVTPVAAVMAGSKVNTVIADDTGVYVGGGGPVSINTTSENVRTGGLFVGMNDFIRMIPSTMMTPFPPQIPFPPVTLPLAAASGLAFFLAMLV